MSTIGVDTGGTFTDLVYLRDKAASKCSRPSSMPTWSLVTSIWIISSAASSSSTANSQSGEVSANQVRQLK
jgi:N-methylhydantoinase A/oxoprolinase/acetone carboxylase beta subunit